VIDVNDKDLKVDIFTNSSPYITMQITHIPSGVSVNGHRDGSRYRLRKALLIELESKVNK